MKWSIVLLFVGLPLLADDSLSHQRVAATMKQEHAVRADLAAGLIPWSPGWWDLSLSPRLSYQFQRAWSCQVAGNLEWQATPSSARVKGSLTELSGGVGWRTTDREPQWSMRAEIARSLPERGIAPLTESRLSTGISLVYDPIIVGLAARVSLPWWRRRWGSPGAPWGGQVSLMLQEVLNDKVLWSLAVSPRWRVDGPQVRWQMTVSWEVGWHSAPWSWSSGLEAGTSQPWTMTSEGGWEWTN